MSCSSCHNPHGSSGRSSSSATPSTTPATPATPRSAARSCTRTSRSPTTAPTATTRTAAPSPAMLVARPPLLCQQCHTPHVAGGVGAVGGQPGVFPPPCRRPDLVRRHGHVERQERGEHLAGPQPARTAIRRFTARTIRPPPIRRRSSCSAERCARYGERSDDQPGTAIRYPPDGSGASPCSRPMAPAQAETVVDRRRRSTSALDGITGVQRRSRPVRPVQRPAQCRPGGRHPRFRLLRRRDIRARQSSSSSSAPTCCSQTRELGLSWKNQGDWKFVADYNEQIHYDPYSVNTGMLGFGTTTPQVVSCRAGPGTGTDVDLKVKRTSVGLGFWKSLTPTRQPRGQAQERGPGRLAPVRQRLHLPVVGGAGLPGRHGDQHRLGRADAARADQLEHRPRSMPG